MRKVIYVINECKIDLYNRTFLKNNVPLELDNMLWLLLKALIEVKNSIATYKYIGESLWGFEYLEVDASSIKTHVNRLRTITGLNIKNKKGLGYYLAEMPIPKFISRLKSHKVNCSSAFFGRSEILEEIYNTFQNETNIIFLKGMGGIGKSEIAKQYAKKHALDYDTVIFGRYEDNLTTLVANDKIFSLEGVYRKQFRATKNKATMHTLEKNFRLLKMKQIQEH